MSCRTDPVTVLMSRHVVSVLESTTVAIAFEQMRDNVIRHLPVVDADGVLAGLLSDRDILGALGTEHAGQYAVETLMQRDVQVVGPDCCVEAAARFMVRSKKGCLPVVDDGGRLLGIITEADFLLHLLGEVPSCDCAPLTLVGVTSL